jgi:diguanylate cyclase (GGDEF)-like protein
LFSLSDSGSVSSVQLASEAPIMTSDLDLSTQKGATQTLTSPALDTQLEKQLEIQIEKAHDAGELLTVVSMELNDPDFFLHAYGTHGVDGVLRTVEECWRAVQRDGDILTRYGDAGFIALLPNADAHAALEICSGLAANIDKKPYQSPTDARFPSECPLERLSFPTTAARSPTADSRRCQCDEAKRGSAPSN